MAITYVDMRQSPEIYSWDSLRGKMVALALELLPKQMRHDSGDVLIIKERAGKIITENVLYSLPWFIRNKININYWSKPEEFDPENLESAIRASIGLYLHRMWVTDSSARIIVDKQNKQLASTIRKIIKDFDQSGREYRKLDYPESITETYNPLDNIGYNFIQL